MLNRIRGLFSSANKTKTTTPSQSSDHLIQTQLSNNLSEKKEEKTISTSNVTLEQKKVLTDYLEKLKEKVSTSLKEIERDLENYSSSNDLRKAKEKFQQTDSLFIGIANNFVNEANKIKDEKEKLIWLQKLLKYKKKIKKIKVYINEIDKKCLQLAGFDDQSQIEIIINSGKAEQAQKQALVKGEEMDVLTDVLLSLEDRKTEIDKLNSTMNNIHIMMHEVNNMVDQQKTSIENTQTHLISANNKVESGKKELQQAEEHQKKSSCTIM